MRHDHSRRSFLARVVGLGAVALLSGAAVAQQPARRMIIDADPRDPARVPTPEQERRHDARRRSRQAPAGAVRSPSSAPSSRFVVCPGNNRCPPR